MKELFRNRVLEVVSSSPLFDQEGFELLYPACLEHLAGQLRAGADPARDCPETFALAVGWLVLDRMQRQDQSSGITAITAGSVSVTRNRDGASSGLEKQALELLRPWRKDPSFAFRGVMG